MVRLVILRSLESYFRHRWLYLLPIVIMGALAAASIYFSEPEYTSTGTLYVQKQTLLNTLTSYNDNGFGWRTPAQATVGEINELMQTDAFVRAVIQRTPLEAEMAGGPMAEEQTLDLLRSSVWRFTIGDSTIRIGATFEDPQVAQQLVAATLESYIQWKLNADRQDSVVAQEFFTELLPSYENERARARDDLDAFLLDHPDPIRGERPTEEAMRLKALQAAFDQADDRVQSTLEKREAAQLALTKAESDARQSFVVVDAPKVPERPTTSLRNLARNAAIYLVVGIILSVGGIIGGALLDRRFRFPLDVRHQLGLPVLAMLPEVCDTGGPQLERTKGKKPAAVTEAPEQSEPFAAATVPAAAFAEQSGDQAFRRSLDDQQIDHTRLAEEVTV